MADIRDKVEQIRQAVYGKDVRESIASGIEAINSEVESTTQRQNAVDEAEAEREAAEEIRQENEEDRVDEHALRMEEVNDIKDAYDAATKANLSVEVSNARTSTVKSKTFGTLKERLEESEQEAAAHMAHYTSLLGELSNVNAVTMITEPWDSTAPTTIDFGFKPSLVIVEAVVRSSGHQSTGVIRGTRQYARQHGGFGNYDITPTGSVYFSNIAGSSDNKLTGSANLTDTGIIINWSLSGSMTASGNRRMVITAFRDFPLG